MRARTLAACAAALAVWTTALTAQDKSARPEKPKAAEAKPTHVRNHTEQIVEIKNRELIGEMQSMAERGYGVSAFRSDDLGILVLGGPPDEVTQAVEAIRRFDVPHAKRPRVVAIGPNAEITGYLLLARNEGDAPSAAMPPAIAPVVTQLKEHFPYKHYEVLETLALRVRNEGEVSGILPPLAPNDPGRMLYKLHLNGIRINSSGEGAAAGSGLLNIGKVQLNIEFGTPTGGQGKDSFVYRNVEIKTGIDIREGQKVVVGKTAVGGNSGTIILVLTAKVIE
jgi:hypothetical protein